MRLLLLFVLLFSSGFAQFIFVQYCSSDKVELYHHLIDLFRSGPTNTYEYVITARTPFGQHNFTIRYDPIWERVYLDQPEKVSLKLPTPSELRSLMTLFPHLSFHQLISRHQAHSGNLLELLRELL